MCRRRLPLALALDERHNAGGDAIAGHIGLNLGENVVFVGLRG